MTQGLLLPLPMVAAPAHRASVRVENHSGDGHLSALTTEGGHAQQTVHPEVQKSVAKGEHWIQGRTTALIAQCHRPDRDGHAGQ
jgi:hypothetical protein